MVSTFGPGRSVKTYGYAPFRFDRGGLFYWCQLANHVSHLRCQGNLVFLVVQFPIVDARAFSEDASRLAVPDFPSPRTYGDPQFLRCFGPAVERRLDVDPAWADEQTYCRADRALRFVNFNDQRLGPLPVQLIPCGIFRRFFSDGEAVCRIEVGIGQPRHWNLPNPVGPAQCLRIAQDFLKLPSKVASFSAAASRTTPTIRYQATDQLVRQAGRLARLYCRATARASAESLSLQERLVEYGRPLLVAEFESREIQDLPVEARAVNLGNGLQGAVAFVWLQTAGGTIPVWLVKRGTADVETLRRLRLCLMRLHAEREGLDIIIKLVRRWDIKIEPGSTAGDRLESYVNRATRLVNKDKFSGISQSAIREAFDAADSVVRPATRESLLQRYEGLRRQVWLKAEKFEQARGERRTVPTLIYNEHVNRLAVGWSELQMGDNYNIDAKESQIGAIGPHSTGTVSGQILVAGARDIAPEDMKTALQSLYAAISQAGLPLSVQIDAQTAVGNALSEGVNGNEVRPEALVTRVKQAADTLTQANTVVEQGSNLGNTVLKVATMMAPIVVGGVRVIAAWFGLAI